MAASLGTQANALVRKNLAFERSNLRSHALLIAFPIVICGLLVSVQNFVNDDKTMGKNLCSPDQKRNCATPNPEPNPSLYRLPGKQYPAVQTNSLLFKDLPEESCRATNSCPSTTLYTAENRSFAEDVMHNQFLVNIHRSNDLNPLSPADISLVGMHQVEGIFQPVCPEPTVSIFVQGALRKKNIDIDCMEMKALWRKSSSVMKKEITKGFVRGNSEGKINEIYSAYDFVNTDDKRFNMSIWYNNTASPLGPREIYAVSNSYIQLLKGADVRMLFDFVKDMPIPTDKFREPLNVFHSGVLSLLFTWVILQLFPVILSSLVYEKQQKLRIMMKMHGLGDIPYWVISYSYFSIISSIYTLCLVSMGSVLGLGIFRQTRFSVQFVFFFVYINLQIAQAFLVSTFFSNVRTATVIGHLYALGSGLMGLNLFQKFLETPSFPSIGIYLLELFPCFSLYRGLYEFEQYSFVRGGMQLKDLTSGGMSGMRDVFIIMLVEWLVFLLVTFYCDQVIAVGSGVKKHPLFFLEIFKRKSSSLQQPTRQDSGLSIQMEKHDVSLERKKVEQLLESSMDYAIVCDNLKKMYPGMDGNPEKFAVRGLSLAVPRGECFGMLGPNGAGKSSSISMMIGLQASTSGTVYIHGLDIRMDMDKIYTSMGVCPQHDLLWETLTAREHLLFYGRLKNLKGAALMQAVDESLESVNLFNVGNKPAGKFSGGMKRRLSVAISLIGNPKVVYLDEPSTGLDPASRQILWDAVRRAKETCAIILTTHSMEEAEALCDRLGIFVDGSLECIGDPTELKGRYGGSYVFTMTTSKGLEKEVENLVKELSPSAKKVYHLSGTQKFELRKDTVRIANVFEAVENAKRRFEVQAWGLTDTTLEDVFIKVASCARSFNV